MPPAEFSDDRLVLYDGVCGVCSHAVRWILDADTAGLFSFAPLQGSSAAAIRARHPELPTDLDSIVYVERRDGTERLYVRADAIFQICEQLSGASFRRVARCRHLPTWLTDVGYQWFARSRQRVSQRLPTCPLPTPDQQRRFLP